MTISKGDHLVIKRGDHVLTPEDGQVHYEFDVLETTESEWQEEHDGTPGRYVTVVSLTVADPPLPPYQEPAQEPSAY